jgi:hypothetical protein
MKISFDEVSVNEAVQLIRAADHIVPPKPITEKLKKEGHAVYRKFWQDNNVAELSKEDIFVAGYIYPKT